MGCCNQPQPPLPPSASGVNPPPYPGPMGTPCSPYKPVLPPVPPFKPGVCSLPCDQTVFRRVVIPATMGNHTTLPPETLEYRNVILEYEADSYVYIFSSDCIPTLISNGTGTNFNDLTNRPMYNGQAMTGLTNIPEVPTSISQLSDAARITCIESTNQALKQSYQVMNTAIQNLTQLTDTQGDTLITLQQNIDTVECKKQDKLVGEGAGQNIKTVNGQNLVGAGNVEITLESAGVQPLLVSGENIKTVNGQDILGAGNLQIDVPEVDLSDYYTKEEVDDELAEKQATLVSGTNIKTINGESILGTGDLTIEEDALEQYTLSAPNLDQLLYPVPTDSTVVIRGHIVDKSEEDGSANVALSTLAAATTAKAGVMTAQQVTDLDNLSTSVDGLTGRLETAENTISELQDYADKTVQTDTKLGTDLSSTVTLIKTTDSLAASQPTDTEIPLPVASESQAGVISADTFKQIMDNASKIEVILGNSTVVPTLPADPTDQQITDAYKEATGQTEVPNGAKVTGPDGKTYIYNATTQKWETYSEGGGAIEVSPFTNTAAGTIKGSDVDGKVFAESDGTGSVKGWDTVKADIANNASALETAQGDITALTTRVTTAEGNITTNTTDVTDLKTRMTAAETAIAANTALIGDVDTALQTLDTGTGVQFYGRPNQSNDCQC